MLSFALVGIAMLKVTRSQRRKPYPRQGHRRAESSGFEVVQAGSADEAIELLDDHMIHLCFTAVQMILKPSGDDLANIVVAFPMPGSSSFAARQSFLYAL